MSEFSRERPIYEAQERLPDHYNPFTGLPCNCAYGSPYKRWTEDHRTASQALRQLKNQNQKFFRDKDGQEFLRALERVSEENGHQIDSLIPWLAKQCKAGELQMRPVYKDDYSPPDLDTRPYLWWPHGAGNVSTLIANNWLQWMNARQHPLRRGKNIMEMGVEEVHSLAAELQRDIQEKNEKENWLTYHGPTGMTRHTFDLEHFDHYLQHANDHSMQADPEEYQGDPLEEGDLRELIKKHYGWHVAELRTEADCEAESEALGHCIGSDDQNYKHNIEDGTIRAFSLRDPDGFPKVTWHFNPDESLAHIQGSSGSPKDEWRHLISLFNHHHSFDDDSQGDGREDNLPEREPQYQDYYELPPATDIYDYMDDYGEGDRETWSSRAPSEYDDAIRAGHYPELETQDPDWTALARDIVYNWDPESPYNNETYHFLQAMNENSPASHELSLERALYNLQLHPRSQSDHEDLKSWWEHFAHHGFDPSDAPLKGPNTVNEYMMHHDPRHPEYAGWTEDSTMLEDRLPTFSPWDRQPQQQDIPWTERGPAWDEDRPPVAPPDWSGVAQDLLETHHHDPARTDRLFETLHEQGHLAPFNKQLRDMRMHEHPNYQPLLDAAYDWEHTPKIHPTKPPGMSPLFEDSADPMFAPGRRNWRNNYGYEPAFGMVDQPLPRVTCGLCNKEYYYEANATCPRCNGNQPQQAVEGGGGRTVPYPGQTFSRKSNILDPIHDMLAPTVWDNPSDPRPKLKPAHRAWIMREVYALASKFEPNPETWLKLVFTGSLTTYQYSQQSDVDISLFVDAFKLPEWDRAKLIGLMVENMDGVKLPGTPYEMQCFVVPKNISPADLYQVGLRSGYDIVTESWIVPPDRSRVHDVEKEYNHFYVYALESADKMERLLRYEPDKAKQYWHQIHARRRRDQQAGKGDFSESNIVYKFMANRGLFDAISELTGEYIARVANSDWMLCPRCASDYLEADKLYGATWKCGTCGYVLARDTPDAGIQGDIQDMPGVGMPWVRHEPGSPDDGKVWNNPKVNERRPMIRRFDDPKEVGRFPGFLPPGYPIRQGRVSYLQAHPDSYPFDPRSRRKLMGLVGKPHMQTPDMETAFLLLGGFYPPGADAIAPWVMRQVQEGHFALPPGIQQMHKMGQNWWSGEQPWQVQQGRYFFPGDAMERAMRGDTDIQPIQPGFLENLPKALRWHKMKGQGLDMNRMNLDDVMPFYEQWEKTMVPDPNAGRVVSEFPDGWTMRELGPHEVAEEGHRMRNCAYTFADKIAAGTHSVHSLRDPENFPKATVIVNNERQEIEDARGHANADLTQRPEYHGLVAQHLQSLPQHVIVGTNHPVHAIPSPESFGTPVWRPWTGEPHPVDQARWYSPEQYNQFYPPHH